MYSDILLLSANNVIRHKLDLFLLTSCYQVTVNTISVVTLCHYNMHAEFL